MNKKLVSQFLLWTFLIMLSGSGIVLLFAHFGLAVWNHSWLYILSLIGGCSPAIASYMALKNNNEVLGFTDWIKNIFTFKAPLRRYLFVMFLFGIVFATQIFIYPGLDDAMPIYMFFASMPGMLLNGGLEEAGWRYVLQPELDKKYGFVLSALIVAPIWALWHLPVFFIPGAALYGTNFGLFALLVLGLTFALGAIRKITNNVFLCVLLHTMVNAGSATFLIKQTLLGNGITSVSLIAVSIAAVFIVHLRNNRSVGGGNVQ
jgi:membrane protease YdiL (CAAX protease family)